MRDKLGIRNFYLYVYRHFCFWVTSLKRVISVSNGAHFFVMPALLSVFFAFSGCSEEKKDECLTSDDCESSEICVQSVCVDKDDIRLCEHDGQCAIGEICSTGVCEPSQTEVFEVDTFRDTVNDDTFTREDSNEPEEPAETDPPEIVTLSPADQETGVALDADVTIVFNEAMDPSHFFLDSFNVTGPDGEWLPGTYTYDEDSYTIRLNPEADFLAATNYKVMLIGRVSDLAGNQLGSNREWSFYTVLPDMSFYEELAQSYAPVVYQDLESGSVQTNYLTQVNFDDDFNLSNNFENMPRYDLEGYLYWNVIESLTHYFIQYIYYYPTRTTTRDENEHDLTGITVVVQKMESDELGELRSVDTYANGRLFSFVPDQSSPDRRVNDGQADINHRFPESDLEDGRRFLSYVVSGKHDSCYWGWGGQDFFCQHTPNAFFSDSAGFIYRYTGTAELPRGLSGEVGYDLLSFLEVFWMNRTDITPNGSGFYQSSDIYSPLGEDRPGGGLSFPYYLASNDFDTHGEMPFAWFDGTVGGNVGEGQWFVDPAFALKQRLTYPEPFSVIYCFNPFLGVDQRGSEECP